MKVLLLDIETAPNLGYTWGKWEQDVIEFNKDWYILCFVAKWLGKHECISSKITDFSAFKKDKTNDKGVVAELRKLLDEADIVIAHNGDAFDIKKINTRMLFWEMTPPRPYKTIDTKKVARRYFRFDSNKLDELGRQLGLGRKVHHEGFPMWLDCMAGEPSAWKKMMKYNKQDVILLEKVYLKLRGWMTNHPNANFYNDTDGSCPNCGGTHLQRRGRQQTLTSEYKRYQCQDCGAWSRSLLEKTYKVQVRTGF